MTISAVIPTYNRRTYVTRAIESVLAQSLPVDELIVVDDGSTDGTAREIEMRFGSHVRVIHQENTGVSGARLRGIREARGEWIAFLDSDDEWVAGRQSKLSAVAGQLPADVAWLFADMRIVTDRGQGKTIFEKFGLSLTGPLQVFEDSLALQFPFQFSMLQNSLIRRTALLEANCFVDNLHVGEDFLAGIKLACRYTFAAIPDVVTNFYRTSDLCSSSLQHNWNDSPDHYRAAMIAWSFVIKEKGIKEQWGDRHARAVRGMCKLLSAQGQSVRGLAGEQFRYGISLKSMAFWCTALLGREGIRVWDSMRNLSNSHISFDAFE